MQAALRPLVTTGIAIVGASTIAVTPLAVPPPSIDISNRAVELSALVNPIDVFRPIFEEAAQDLQSLGQLVAANPAPILAQILANQPGNIANLPAGALAQLLSLPQLPSTLADQLGELPATLRTLTGLSQTFLQNLITVLTGTEPGTVYDQVQSAIASAKTGDLGTAFQYLAVIPLLPILGPSLSNLELIAPLVGVVQQQIQNAAELLPIAAGPLTNASNAVGVFNDIMNVLPVGLGVLVTVSGVATATGNTIGGVIAAVQNGDPEGIFNTIVTQAGAAAESLVQGTLTPVYGLAPGLQGLRETIAAAIAPQAAYADIAKAPAAQAKTFTLTTTQEKTPEVKSGNDVTDLPKAETDSTPTTSDNTVVKKKDDDTTKDGNKSTPNGNTGGRHRADIGNPFKTFTQGLRDAAEKTVKGITGIGHSTDSTSDTASDDKASSEAN